ncbi:hypothetical protein J2M53_10755 [Arthrobacter sp. zg-ZUI100]|uniref:hypothetical protein n=1 Tax=Arthrobacter jiangjiafuii TaxID=2817475 RepID=UPI001AED55BA|nr:hypothetical protein [Arthrobacter jiangjiafuii]MBP3036722.1 hypothetical protein [Arthrobacter jiangjiafuii]
MSIRPAFARVLPATLLAVLVLAGCAAVGPGADPDSPGPGLAGPAQPGPEPLVPSGEATFIGEVDLDPKPAASLDGRGNLSLVTYGSSSCPPVVAGVEATSADTIAIALDASAEGPCTADIAPTTHTVPLPAGLTERPTTVQIKYVNEPWEYTIPVS